MTRLRAELLIVVVVLLAIGPAAGAQPSILATARLEGNFVLHGRITVATGVRGEQVGERITRQWTFVPQCPAGPCAQVALARRRAQGFDLLVLRRVSPTRYAGAGTFYAPLRCAATKYQNGEAVPFRITVRITAAVNFDGVIVATAVRASYVNRRRVNLTPCVRPPARERAVYRGRLVPA